MARVIEYIEGFDAMSAASDAAFQTDLGRAYELGSPTGFIRTTGVAGAGRGCRISDGSSLYFPLASLAEDEVIVGFHWLYNVFSNVDINVCSITSPSGGAHALRDIRVRLRGNTTNDIDLRIIRGAGGGVVMGTAVLTLLEDTWYYAELRVKRDTGGGTDGEVTLRHKLASDSGDPVAIITLTGVDTTDGASPYDFVAFSNDAFAARFVHIDSLYIASGTSLTDSDFLGQIDVVALKPNGNGVANDFTSTDANNFEAVDDAPDVDDDTTYNETDLTAQRDVFAYEDAVDVRPIVALQVSTIAREHLGSSPATHAVVRSSGGTEVDGPDFALTSSFQTFQHVQELEPGGAAWDDTKVSAAQFGYES